MIGKKGENEPADMSIVERKYRFSIWIKLKNHTAEAVNEALSDVLDQFGDKTAEVFKTITGDNRSEFADLAKLEVRGIGVYFTHPYTSCEKGPNKCHNRMLRRFIRRARAERLQRGGYSVLRRQNQCFVEKDSRVSYSGGAV